ncbi:site-specific integrase [Pedobacter cryoconitis]|uniref:Integrase-like protein n=1 Tax=Pedobacter cryoconitis TaxID=188932 RepID=A0A327SEX7_9SPHI|nr:site-specific integrase [Pedobacter cryoconitis]RAJ24297.1 integrase-like protein [Pedobacter cryoconitis]
MAKLTPVILDEEPNAEGEWNVKIRIGHKSKSAYISTDEFVSKKHLTKEWDIKTSFVVSHLTDILNEYNEILKQKKSILPHIDHLQLKELLTGIGNEYKPGEEVMFLNFAKEHTESIKLKQYSTYKILKTTYQSLSDYLNHVDIPATEITPVFLEGYEKFLRSDREVARLVNGKLIKTERAGLGNSGVNAKMNNIRKLHNLAKEKYNDEDEGVILIPNNPFKKYKIVARDEVEDRDFSIDQIVKIRDCKLKVNSRTELARDIWMLSFYLCGMNSVDIFHNSGKNVERVVYNRQKTKGKRTDKALMSVNIIDEAVSLHDKYMGKMQVRYSNIGSLNLSLHYGIKELRKILGAGFEKLDMYSARHSIASIAANECGYSTEQVGAMLNHYGRENKVTRGYIRRSWAIVDQIQAAVIALLPPFSEIINDSGES